jgi:prepilin-type N-terminal cleavage/methylation domain-containing protein
MRAFTLIETLVAITVLVVAVSTPVSLAAQSLFAAFYAKDQTTAFYLAQEGVEMIKNTRDHNLLVLLRDNGVGNWLDGIALNTDLYVDTPHNQIYTSGTCPQSCPALAYDGVFYNHANGVLSRFARTVRVTQDTADANEALVTSTVTWKTGSFKERSFSVSERIYNWLPE